ncbi:MAG: hypothetical protein GX230_06690, partial [Lentisphaerae bacterium]|nr:hypothetical protein [Lentisphaerota bacterium]
MEHIAAHFLIENNTTELKVCCNGFIAERGCSGEPATTGSIGFGQGGGKSVNGGGYGGDGGIYSAVSGKAYGPKIHPTDPGSGGAGSTAGTSSGGHGGGLIWIHSDKRTTVEGTLNAKTAYSRNQMLY